MRKLIHRGLPSFLALLALGTLRGQNARGAQSIEDFQLEGAAIWQCQCPAYACPCQKNGLPTQGMCHASDFAHVRRGHYGKVRLDDMNVVMVGDLVDGTPDRLFATLYIDNKATPAQREALKRIVGFMNEEANQPPVPFRTVKVVPISFHESADRTEYTVEIPDTLNEKALLKRDSSGKPHLSMAAMDLWSNVVHNADNVEFKYHDSEIGEGWDFSGHYSNLKFFDISKQMYDRKQMLGQYGDNSGKWTRKQSEIIRQQGLPDR